MPEARELDSYLPPPLRDLPVGGEPRRQFQAREDFTASQGSGSGPAPLSGVLQHRWGGSAVHQCVDSGWLTSLHPLRHFYSSAGLSAEGRGDRPGWLGFPDAQRGDGGKGQAGSERAHEGWENRVSEFERDVCSVSVCICVCGCARTPAGQ